MDEAAENANGGSEVRQTIIDALTSKELLVPAALSAAAAVAATKGPALARQLTSKTEEIGDEQAQRLAKKGAEAAKQSLTGGGGGAGLLKGLMGAGGSDSDEGSGQGGGKKTRRLPIERWTDVAVPVDRAYRAWTKFENYPNYMHRVLEVEPEDDDTIRWREKIWFSKREWEGKITDRRANDRIAWKTVSGTSHSGIVSFHPIAENLTRVMVTVEFEPQGMIEKMASGLRFVKRAVESDLARFKAYVEFEDAKELEYPTGGAGENGSSGKDNGKRDDGRKRRESRREQRRQSVGANGS